MIGGVCVGLADYFDVDVALLRAGFIATSVTGGFGAALYLALWVLLDDATPALRPGDARAEPEVILRAEQPEASQALPILGASEFPMP